MTPNLFNYILWVRKIKAKSYNWEVAFTGGRVCILRTCVHCLHTGVQVQTCTASLVTAATDLLLLIKKRPNNSKQLPLILLLQAQTGRRSSGHISGTLKLIPPKNTFLCYYWVQGFAQFLWPDLCKMIRQKELILRARSSDPCLRQIYSHKLTTPLPRRQPNLLSRAREICMWHIQQKSGAELDNLDIWIQLHTTDGNQHSVVPKNSQMETSKQKHKKLER